SGEAGPGCKALSQHEGERGRLAEELERGRSAAHQAERARTATEAERVELDRRRRSEELDHRQRLKAELDRAAAEIKELLVAIRAERSVEAATRAQTELGAKVKELQQHIQQDRDRLEGLDQQEAPAEVKGGPWWRH